MPASYPVLLDLSDITVLIVGGGCVAARKARGLLDAGARRIRVVAPDVCEEMPGDVQHDARWFAIDDLDGAQLVFAATDDTQVNDEIVCAARKRGVFACRADAPRDASVGGTFVTPAVLRKGPITVAVATDGNPALSAALRDHLAELLDGKWEALATAAAALRPMVQQSSELTPAQRHEIFRAMATDEAMRIMQSGGLEGLKEWLAGRFPTSRDLLDLSHTHA